jgi:hypothetical protein
MGGNCGEGVDPEASQGRELPHRSSARGRQLVRTERYIIASGLGLAVVLASVVAATSSNSSGTVRLANTTATQRRVERSDNAMSVVFSPTRSTVASSTRFTRGVDVLQFYIYLDVPTAGRTSAPRLRATLKNTGKRTIEFPGGLRVIATVGTRQVAISKPSAMKLEPGASMVVATPMRNLAYGSYDVSAEVSYVLA